MSWIATVLVVHGGLSRAGGWAILLLIATVLALSPGIRLVRSLSRASAALARLFRRTVSMGHVRVRSRASSEIGFPWNLLGYPASANLALLQITPISGHLGASLFSSPLSIRCLPGWRSLPRPQSDSRHAPRGCHRSHCCRHVHRPPFRPTNIRESLRPCRTAQFPGGYGVPAELVSGSRHDLDEIEQLSLAPSNHSPIFLSGRKRPAPFPSKIPSSRAMPRCSPFIFSTLFLPESSSGSLHPNSCESARRACSGQQRHSYRSTGQRFSPTTKFISSRL